jgi:hypothetical protein
MFPQELPLLDTHHMRTILRHIALLTHRLTSSSETTSVTANCDVQIVITIGSLNSTRHLQLR